ncbi:MAG: trypsin-like peptidase domain-containing protein [Myxococcota bacterium]
MEALEAYLGRIATHVRGNIGQGGFEDPTPGLIQDYAQDRYEREAAMRGWRNLKAGRPVAENEANALEQLVLTLHRPSLDVIEDTFNDPEPPWNDLWQYQDRLRHAIRATGVLKIFGGNELLFNSCGVLCAPDRILTNRHVAEQLAQGVGTGGLKPIPQRSARINFRQEVWASESSEFEIRRVCMIHPYWDMAMLEVEPVSDRRPMVMMGSEPPFLESGTVVTIGYPAMDAERDLELQGRVFREQFNVKRLQPGTPLGYRAIASYQHRVMALAVDSSTLAINSGAAVVDPDTGRMMGLQFLNVYLEANYAIPTWELARDPQLRDWNLIFEPPAPTEDAPPQWVMLWETEAGESLNDQEPEFVLDESDLLPVSDEHQLKAAILGGDWYERCTDEDIVEALRRTPEATQASLHEVLSPQQARETIDALTAPHHQRHGFWPNPEPRLPEIVFIHDFMGCHLSHTGVGTSRIWLDPQRVLSGGVARAFELGEDGLREAHGERPMTPGGLLRFKYAHPLRQWRRDGFVVHPFIFDWRHGLDRNADRLHLYLETLRLSRPGLSFALVAHGLGGLVAALYAHRHRSWADLIQRAVFIGVPLGGCFMPVEALTGRFALFEKLRLLSAQDTDNFPTLAATLPGLLDMLPNPHLFDHCELFYQQPTWAEWVGISPSQRWLDHSRSLKRPLLNSPILDRVSALVSVDHGTTARMRLYNDGFALGPREAPGDGVVPALSALGDQELEAYRLSFPHADLVQEPHAIAATQELLRTGTCALEPLKRSDLTRVSPMPPDNDQRLEPKDLQGLRERFASGRLLSRDADWLMVPNLASPPNS